MPRRGKHGRLTIVDRSAVAELAQWIIDHKGGSWSDVDSSLRRLQPTLSRLVNKKLSAISVRAFEQIAERLRTAGDVGANLTRFYQLSDAVLSEAAQRVQVAYRSWLLVNLEAPYTGRTVGRYEKTPSGPMEATRDRDATDKVILRDRKRLLRQVRGDPKCAAMLRRFADWAADAHHEAGRIELALVRVIEPLVQAAETGFIERSVDDLTNVATTRRREKNCSPMAARCPHSLARV